jgi:hypothetical protein
MLRRPPAPALLSLADGPASAGRFAALSGVLATLLRGLAKPLISRSPPTGLPLEARAPLLPLLLLAPPPSLSALPPLPRLPPPLVPR